MCKYDFTGETKTYEGRTLRRIYAVQGFGICTAGQPGGWIENESNLSHEGDCWVCEDAAVYGDAVVSGNAIIGGYHHDTDDILTEVCDHAEIFGDAEVFCCVDYADANEMSKRKSYNYTKICQRAKIYGDARVNCSVVCGSAKIYDTAEVMFTMVGGTAQIHGDSRLTDSFVPEGADICGTKVPKQEIVIR